MDDLYSRLEAQVRALILQCNHLKHTNNKLNQAKASLIREKEMLLSKHKKAVTQIEHMISRLKLIEGSQ